MSFPDMGLALKVQEVLDGALRLAGDKAILHIRGAADGVPFVIAVAAGPGAERLTKIIADNGVVDPRST